MRRTVAKVLLALVVFGGCSWRKVELSAYVKADKVAKEVGAPDDLLERITGYKRIANYDPPDVTYVDAMMENLLRAMAFGFYMNTGHRRALEQILGDHGRADRLAQFEQIWSYGLHLSQLEQNEANAREMLKSARDAALQTSAVFTRSTKE